MVEISNKNVLIRYDETPADIIASICNDNGISPNEPFAFSAIMRPAKDDGYYMLKINRLEPSCDNPYSVTDLILSLYEHEPNNHNIRYVQPPLERWLEYFRPLMIQLVQKVQPRYERLIPEREELMAILNLTICKLYNKGFYLHKTLILKSFVNDLNMECRYLKGKEITDSLDVPIGLDDDGKEITLLDQLADQESTDWAKQSTTYTDSDYWSDMYERIKTAMLKDMSEFQFNRIMIQLKSKTLDRQTIYKLSKYRELFNPGYSPRPNRRRK